VVDGLPLPVPPLLNPELRYHNYGAWIRRRTGRAAIRIGVDGGFTCPNRDAGGEGCFYCNNEGFTPGIRHAGLSVAEQLRLGIERAGTGRKAAWAGRKGYRFHAYFQKFTNTFGPPESLDRLYREALACPGVDGLVVGTRPDCLESGVLDVLREIALERYVMVEIGLQSTSDRVLSGIGRGHTVADFERAVRAVRGAGIDVGAHLIHGLPGDTTRNFVEAARFLSALDVQGVKLHHFHVVAGTRAERAWREGRIGVPDYGEHVLACADFLERLSPGIAVMRLSGEASDGLLLAPRWARDGERFAHDVTRELARRGSCQGFRAEAERTTG
jgi:radical SAM protein (TIGR01212 family)